MPTNLSYNHRLTSGSKALVVYKKKFILILRDNKPDIPWPNVWNLPGGGIDEGETPKEAMLRELQEKICVVPKNTIYLGSTKFSEGVKAYRFVSYLTDEEYKKVKLGDEGQKMDFFTLDEADKLELAPFFREYFDANKEKIRALVDKS